MKQTSLLLFFLAWFAVMPGFGFAQIAVEDWNSADSLTVRLPPSEFEILPQNIVQYLEKNGYTIPQCWCETGPHNVISGTFVKKGQSDWAVLASRNRVSRILVFRNGAGQNPDEISELPDRNFLIETENDSKGFTRAISTVGEDRIMMYYDAYGGTEPPPIEYDGINDAFIERGSVIHYYYNGEWLSLTGAD
jgi:hypothetical protein